MDHIHMISLYHHILLILNIHRHGLTKWKILKKECTLQYIKNIEESDCDIFQGDFLHHINYEYISSNYEDYETDYDDKDDYLCYSNDDCDTNLYCAETNYCYDICYCKVFDDSYTGECPDIPSDYDCNDYYSEEGQTYYSYNDDDYNTCETSRECNDNQYCWNPIIEDESSFTSTAMKYTISNEGFCDSCCYCEEYKEILLKYDISPNIHQVDCPDECNDDCSFIEYFNTCEIHDDCNDNQYCNDYKICQDICDCKHQFNSIDNICPDHKECLNSCSTNEDCINDNEYCTIEHTCVHACNCQEKDKLKDSYDYMSKNEFDILYSYIPIDGECTIDCEYDIIVDPIYECNHHKDCGIGSYCDTFSQCNDICSCEYFNDAIDGICPYITKDMIDVKMNIKKNIIKIVYLIYVMKIYVIVI